MTRLFFWISNAFADEAVDLSALGMSDFNPYIFDRETLWILLPLISLILVFLHLIPYSPLGRNRETKPFEHHSPEDLL